MASKISSIYDAIHTKVAAVLTDHTELHNPTDIELNEDVLLNKGYGIVIGPAVRVDRHVTCNYWLERDVIITNTLTIYGAENDKTIRKTREKTLFENQYAIIDAIEKDITLSDQLNNFRFISDNGIQYINTEEIDNVMLKSTFRFEYFESLN